MDAKSVQFNTEGSDQAWYETERGILPVAQEVLEEALQGGHEVLEVEASGEVAVLHQYSERGLKAAEPNTVSTRGSSGDQSGAVDGGSDRCCSSARTHISETAVFALQDTNAPQEPAERVSGKTPRKRTAIPNPIVRLVCARAGHRCECCGKKGGRLDVHHRDPVCEGGANDPDCLELLCRACHTKKHEADFESKAHWREARTAASLRARRPEEVLVSKDSG